MLDFQVWKPLQPFLWLSCMNDLASAFVIIFEYELKASYFLLFI